MQIVRGYKLLGNKIGPENLGQHFCAQVFNLISPSLFTGLFQVVYSYPATFNYIYTRKQHYTS